MLKVEPIHAFSDNYIWLLYRPDSTGAWVVDPGDPAPVRVALKERGLQLEGILITHHHFDHVGGLESLAKDAAITVYGPVNAKIGGITQPLVQDNEVSVLGCSFRVLEVPGHTMDHIAFYAASEKLLFCGDTLFAGGCGRMFEGTPDVMQASLASLAALPADTTVFCAHEYTLANLAFASAVEPDNEALKARVSDANALRSRDLPTVPSTLGLELATNPFLRLDQPAVQQAALERGENNVHSLPAVFASIRNWKDNF